MGYYFQDFEPFLCQFSVDRLRAGTEPEQLEWHVLYQVSHECLLEGLLVCTDEV